MPLQFFAQSTPFVVSVSASPLMPPHTKSWRLHCYFHVDNVFDRRIKMTQSSELSSVNHPQHRALSLPVVEQCQVDVTDNAAFVPD